MLSIGEGAKQEALEQISILGINNIIVKRASPRQPRASMQAFGRSPGLSLDDGANISRFSNLISRPVVPQRIETDPVDPSAGDAKPRVRVVATLPAYVLASSIDVEQGVSSPSATIRTSARSACWAPRPSANCSRSRIRSADGANRRSRLHRDRGHGGQVHRRGKVEGLELKNLNEDVYIPFSTAVKKFDRSALDRRDLQSPRAHAVRRLGKTPNSLQHSGSGPDHGDRPEELTGSFRR